MSDPYFELEMSDHCGTFVIGKIAQDRPLTWAIRDNWFGGDFYSGAYVACGPHLTC